jgi:hypothetical protein
MHQCAGFGPQASLENVDTPLGHLIKDGKPKAMLPGTNGDNPLIVGPAGTMHMSVLDFAKWVAWHAGDGKRSPALVSPDIVKKLHTPVIGTSVREDTRRQARQRREDMRSAGDRSTRIGHLRRR